MTLTLTDVPQGAGWLPVVLLNGVPAWAPAGPPYTVSATAPAGQYPLTGYWARGTERAPMAPRTVLCHGPQIVKQ